MKRGSINILLTLIFSTFLLSCTSNQKSIDKSTDYKNDEQRYGTAEWRDIKDKNKLEEKSSLMSAKPESKNKENKFIDNYMKNLEKKLLLNYKKFNETEHKGWREYLDLKDYNSAHKLIDAYIVKHKETLTKEQLDSLKANSIKMKALINNESKK